MKATVYQDIWKESGHMMPYQKWFVSFGEKTVEVITKAQYDERFADLEQMRNSHGSSATPYEIDVDETRIETAIKEHLIGEYNQMGYNHDCTSNFGVVTNFIRPEHEKKIMAMSLEDAEKEINDLGIM